MAWKVLVNWLHCPWRKAIGVDVGECWFWEMVRDCTETGCPVRASTSDVLRGSE